MRAPITAPATTPTIASALATSPLRSPARPASRISPSRIQSMRVIAPGFDVRRSNLVEKRSTDMSHGTHYRWDDIPKEPLRPDLGRKLIATDRMMIAQVFLQKGALVAKHSHENEQLTWIVEGTLRLWL